MPVKMTLRYEGDLRCEIEHGPSASRISTDAPTDNMGKGESFSPTDLVGAALASCALTTMAIKGRGFGIEFGVAQATVDKTMTAQAPRKIARFDVAIDMPADLPAEERARLEEIARTCPVALSLAGDVDVAMVFAYR